MRRFVETMFDAWVYAGKVWFTADMHERLLGASEQLVIQASIDAVAGTDPRITLDIEHANIEMSNDAYIWNLYARPFSGEAVFKEQANVLWWSDDSSLVKGSRARFAITLAGTEGAMCYARIIVCGRDTAKTAIEQMDDVSHACEGCANRRVLGPAGLPASGTSRITGGTPLGLEASRSYAAEGGALARYSGKNGSRTFGGESRANGPFAHAGIEVGPGLLPQVYATQLRTGRDLYPSSKLWPYAYYSMPCDLGVPDPIGAPIVIPDEVKPQPPPGMLIPPGGTNTLEIQNVWPVNTAGQKLVMTAGAYKPGQYEDYRNCLRLVCEASLWIYDFVEFCWHSVGTKKFVGHWPDYPNSHCKVGEDDPPWSFPDLYNANPNWFVTPGGLTPRTKIRVRAFTYDKWFPNQLLETAVLWNLNP